jgi:transcriptional regulator with XRE-family HTH domain
MSDLPPIKLRLWRRYRGLSQRELATRAGITQATIHLLETTDQEPLTSTIQSLARALDCTPSQLYFSPIDVEERKHQS